MNWSDYWEANTFDLAHRVQTVRNLLKLANPFGVTFQRYGSATDGGYILADDIEKRTVISCGIDNNVEFEQAMSSLGCIVQMFDNSIDVPPAPVLNGIFKRATIGELPLDEIIVHDCILKLDIEGAEWDALADAKRLGECRQIVMEAHWLFNLPYDAFYTKVIEALTNLRKTHTPVWIHANNDQPLIVMGAQPIPNVFEILYLRNDYPLCSEPDPFAGLTVPNNPTWPEIGLSFP